jgi:hypothetical protein
MAESKPSGTSRRKALYRRLDGKLTAAAEALIRWESRRAERRERRAA